MRNKIMEVSRRSFSTGLCAALTIGMLACSSSDQGEPEAARATSLARDVEGNIERLDEAIEAYRKIATEYGTTPSGKKATTRVAQLTSITGMIDGFQSAHEDSLPSVAGAILRKAPNYEPVLHRLGNHYANRSNYGLVPHPNGRMRAWAIGSCGSGRSRIHSGRPIRSARLKKTEACVMCSAGTRSISDG